MSPETAENCLQYFMVRAGLSFLISLPLVFMSKTAVEYMKEIMSKRKNKGIKDNNKQRNRGATRSTFPQSFE